MKQVLVIDESPLLREYLRLKLEENGIKVHVAINGLDGIAKIRNLMPDLVILDYHLSRQSCLEVLEEKKKSPNTAPIPVIITAQHIDQKKIIELVKHNVKKVFTKPIKIDALYQTLSELLNTTFELDTTPCIAEAHVNDDIVFVEIAQGLNREKIDLLGFKIQELLTLYDIHTPKLILMLSDLKLSFADASNLEKLVNSVITSSKAKHRNVRILSKDPFFLEFMKGHKEYSNIEVVTNLQYALEGLLSELDGRMEFGERRAEIIGDRVLQATNSDKQEAMQMKFSGERQGVEALAAIRESERPLKIAAVDDDMVIQELLKATFAEIKAEVIVYPDGADFLEDADKVTFDLVFLDLLMPKVGGFQVLQDLKAKDIHQPIIVLSAVTSRDAVVKAFQSGVKSYLVKPLKSDAIFKKALEILRPNF